VQEFMTELKDLLKAKDKEKEAPEPKGKVKSGDRVIG